MDAYLRMTPADRRFACLKVMEQKRLQAASVDKDFWVCWTLRELFWLADIGKHITFKGGTSLSKAWGLIERFSEDIDIVVDKDVLGFGGDAGPDRAPSKKQRGRRLEGLMDACRDWVQKQLQPALERSMGKRMGVTKGWKIEVDPDVEDGQCLLFHYPGAFPAAEAGYVRQVVKIECGARSDHWPSESCTVTPYVADVFPEAVPDAAFHVSALAAERTFWEKAMLLHEETFRPVDKPRKERMARHYYDVWCLITRGVADRAAADRDLFSRVAEHREIFFKLGWVDYKTLRPGLLRLSPLAGQGDAWQRDYEEMAEAMFYGERPEFDEILRVVGEFERRFNETAVA
jgi:predicted nucleotidyltransferase component of viral defense system